MNAISFQQALMLITVETVGGLRNMLAFFVSVVNCRTCLWCMRWSAFRTPRAILHFVSFRSSHGTAKRHLAFSVVMSF